MTQLYALSPTKAEISINQSTKQVVIGFQVEDLGFNRFVLCSDDAFGLALDIVQRIVALERGIAAEKLLSALSGVITEARKLLPRIH